MTVDRREAVDHPSHYGGGSNVYEAIKVIAAWGLNFALGNTVKYIARAGKKDAAKLVEDLEKAEWYLGWHIDSLISSAQKCTHLSRPVGEDGCGAAAYRLVNGQPRCQAHTPKVTRLK